MYSRIFDFIPEGKVKFNEFMKNHTTFKIGGPADVMVTPRNINDIKNTISFCHNNKIKFYVLGLGSNLLVTDKGVRGVVIKLGNQLKEISVCGEEIYAEAGIRLAELAKKAGENSLSGLEFAEGIPGSLGGAVVMNAGAYDGEMKNVVVEATAIDNSGRIQTFTTEEIQFGYRSTIFQNSEHIVVSAKLNLTKGHREAIQAKMREFSRRRREKQPLEHPSAGSTFRRPEGFYVGPMLEQMGLKGYRIGGAEVSAKHAGFIINRGNATASDVLELIEYIQRQAKDQFGVYLKPEVKVIGE